MIAATALALAGVWAARMAYLKGTLAPKNIVGLAPDPEHPATRVGGTGAGRALFAFFTNKWGMDGLFLGIAALGDRGIAAASDWVDRRVVDRITYGLGRIAFGGSDALRRATDGVVRNYTAWIIGGLALSLILLKYVVPGVSGGG